MNTTLPLIFVLTLVLSGVAAAETAPRDPDQLLRDYQAAELSYQQAAKTYRNLRRDVRGDPELKEKIFKTSRPTIGLQLGPVPDDGQGVLVRSVIPGSMAEQAGLRAEDIVLAVDEVRIDELSGARAVQSMRRAISRDDTGTSVRIEYLRGGEISITDTRTQTPAEIAWLRDSMPGDQNTGNTTTTKERQAQALRESNRQYSSAPEGGAVIHWSGLTFVNMTPALGSYFGIESGVLLVHNDGSLPLAEGDVVLKIGRQDLVNASQAVNLLQGYDRDKTMTFEIWRHRQSIRLEFTFNTSTLAKVIRSE